jgi:hypothetical protein
MPARVVSVEVDVALPVALLPVVVVPVVLPVVVVPVEPVVLVVDAAVVAGNSHS